MRIKVAPSILAADFSCLAEEIKRVESAGADMIHIDVMDGHFVPNITLGPEVVRAIRKITALPLDVHLMIENPGKYVNDFIEAGSDIITLHVETVSKQEIKKVKLNLDRNSVKLGISLNPQTPLAKIRDLLSLVDLVLVMSVNPGFSGQKFMPQVLPKIKKLRSIFKGDISVDGGVNAKVASSLIKAGANILACGSYIFMAKDTRSAIERIRNAR